MITKCELRKTVRTSQCGYNILCHKENISSFRITLFLSCWDYDNKLLTDVNVEL